MSDSARPWNDLLGREQIQDCSHTFPEQVLHMLADDRKTNTQCTSLVASTKGDVINTIIALSHIPTSKADIPFWDDRPKTVVFDGS